MQGLQAAAEKATPKEAALLKGQADLAAFYKQAADFDELRGVNADSKLASHLPLVAEVINFRCPHSPRR